VHALVVLLFLISITTTEGVISDRPITTAPQSTTSNIRITREEEEIKTMTASEEYEIINKELDDMPLLPITSDETVRACRMLAINPSHDIFICSYPKR
jgi:hypothetical protein